MTIVAIQRRYQADIDRIVKLNNQYLFLVAKGKGECMRALNMYSTLSRLIKNLPDEELYNLVTNTGISI
ncbi:hypothetical protein [Vibrio parahaemolyticus]|uniref:hypothetical protein n=1 Tax=Vibrio parahaemolyticus TaxID=670 RepID=UPI00226B8AFB|nr:hypothetical protein [Vibrio parahaemolyticus]MCX8941256.1 hypothetical protein [Vibrio parahaemolyticus]